MHNLIQEISDIIDDKTTALYPDNTQIFISNAVTSKKPAFVLFYEGKDFSMSFRTLGQMSKYSDKFMYANFKNPSSDVKQQFNLKQLPTLVVIFLKDPDNEDMDPRENIQVAHFTGHYNWAELSNFLDQFVAQEDKLVERNMKQVVEIQTNNDFQNYCVKRGQTCLLALLNGDKSDGQLLARLQDQQAVLDKVQQRFLSRPISIMWIDATCHDEVLTQLEFPHEWVPTLVSYSPTKQQFSQIVGNFEYDSITSWLDKVLKVRVSTTDLKHELTIDSKDCVEQHSLIKEREAQSGSSSSVDDEILREILEDEKKRKAAQGDNDVRGGKKKKQKKKKADADEL